MRVITTFFSIESLQPAFDDRPFDESVNDLTPETVKDALNASRKWLGMHEGENRVVLLEKWIPRRRTTARKVHLNVLFSTVLID
jgi:hypothetical protein